MKKIIFLLAIMALPFQIILGQSEIDALKYSKLDLNGTARFMSMGGAFGALGGDVSSLANNPAGIGVYRSSEFVATMNLSNTSTSSLMTNNTVDANNWHFNFNNATYVGTYKTEAEGLVSFSFGLGFNRLKNYNREYTTNGTNLGASLTDYIASVTNRYNNGQGIKAENLDVVSNYSGYNYNYPWIGVLGWNGDLIDPVKPNDIANNYKYVGIGTFNPNSNLRVSERGSVDEYDISFGGNLYETVYFGATVGITDLDYRTSTSYNEDLGANVNYTLNNYLETRGSGVNLKLGLIYRPTNFLRLGFAFHTPTYYRMTDYYSGNVKWNTGATANNANTPSNAYAEYSLKTPLKLQSSAALILGKKAIVSFEYEYVDYSTMKMKDPDGYGWSANDYIKDDMIASHSFRIGGEYRITPQLSLRGGYATQNGVVHSSIINQDYEVDMMGATLPHYTLDRGTTYYTGGIGYRFGVFYVDLAYVNRQTDEDVYSFSPIRNDNNQWIVPEKATLKTTSVQYLMTLGLKF